MPTLKVERKEIYSLRRFPNRCYGHMQAKAYIQAGRGPAPGLVIKDKTLEVQK